MTGLLAEALLPPAGLAVAAAVLLLAGWRRAGLAALVALVLLSMPAVPHILIGPLLQPVAHGSAPPGAIVVLSADGPDGPETLLRLRAAAALARRTGLPVLVAGTPPMAASLRDDFGIEPRWTATGSASLWRTAAAAAALLRAADIGSAYLVGEPWEARLSAAVFGAAGLSVWTSPATDPARRNLDWSTLLPITPAWLYSADVIAQWAGLACQAIPPCVAAQLVRPGPS